MELIVLRQHIDLIWILSQFVDPLQVFFLLIGSELVFLLDRETSPTPIEQVTHIPSIVVVLGL